MSGAFSWSRWIALVSKEFAQLRRNRQLLFLLLFPPVIEVLQFGVALKPIIRHLTLAVVDEARTPASRDLIDAFTANAVFVPRTLASSRALDDELRAGHVDAGLLIPDDFDRRLRRNEPAQIRLAFDGVNSYVAGTGAGFAAQIVAAYNRRLAGTTAVIVPEVVFAYNPGLLSAWFFVPGMLGAIIMLTGILASASESVREKDEGTLEQLLMTPSSALEILLAKMVPLFTMFAAALLLSLGLARLAFGLPVRGNFALFLALSALYIVTSVAIGMLISTFASTKQQVILISIFVALPLVMLSGAFAPIESMPPFWQSLALLNPLRHYIAIIRAILLKGVGLETLWPNVLALIGFGVLAIGASTARYRSQLR